MKVIAHIRSDFPEKFEFRIRAAGSRSSRQPLCLSRSIGSRRPLRGFQSSAIFGFCGSFPRPSVRTGRPPCGRPGWAEIPERAYLRPVLLSPQSHRALLCEAGTDRNASEAGTGAPCVRSGSDG